MHTDATILQTGLGKLGQTEDRCVEIKDDTPQISTFGMFSLSLFPQPDLICSGGIKGIQ